MPDIDELAVFRISMSFLVAMSVRYLTWGLLSEERDERVREQQSIVTGILAAVAATVLSLVGG